MTSIALVEDHELLAAALETALSAEGYDVLRPPLTSCAQIIPARQIGAALAADPPDVLLVDLDLGPAGSGADVISCLAGAGTSIVVVSGTDDECAVGRCLALGAAGWVPKTASFDVLLEAVVAAAAGQPVMSPAHHARLEEAWQRRRDATVAAHERFDRLTRREAAVLGLLMEGEAVERIAKASFVSVATIRTQVRAILQKLGVNSQLEAVADAVRVGWVPPALPLQRR